MPGGTFGPAAAAAAASSSAAGPIKLSITVGAAGGSGAADEIANLKSQVQQLEERLEREAQSWAEQRAELLRVIKDKDEALWQMMNGEVTIVGGPAPVKKEKKKEKLAATDAADASAKPKADAAKPKAAGKAAGKAKAAGSTPAKKAKAGGGAAASGWQHGSSGDAVEVEKNLPQAEEVAAATPAGIADPGGSSIDAEGGSSSIAMAPEQKSAVTQSSFVSSPEADSGGFDDESGSVGDGSFSKAPMLKGFRPRPGWVPQLEIRLAMVKSPKGKKAQHGVGGGGAGKGGGGGNAAAKKASDAAAKKAEQEAKKKIQQMGGVNGFGPKAGAGNKPKGAAGGGAKLAAGGAKKGAPVKV